MTGMGEGARVRGRPKMRWLAEVTGSTKLSLFDLRNAVDDRHRVAKIYHGIDQRLIVS